MIDEFESLLREQQVALNTTMKMRLPDVTLKIGVRRSGRKTSDTFTVEDPIQTPRDYTAVPLDYDISSSDYGNLLAGIADKRLRHSGYQKSDIRSYLVNQQYPEVTGADLDANQGEEVHPIWSDTRNIDPFAPQNGVLHDEDVFTTKTDLPDGTARPSTGQVGKP